MSIWGRVGLSRPFTADETLTLPRLIARGKPAKAREGDVTCVDKFHDGLAALYYLDRYRIDKNPAGGHARVQVKNTGNRTTFLLKTLMAVSAPRICRRLHMSRL